jgi:hypothetical protein
MPPPLDRLVDALAMWVEDRRRRAPVGFRAGDAGPLGCFGPLPPLPGTAPRDGIWRIPSPRPAPGDAVLCVVARPARGPRRGTAILVPPWKVPSLAIVAGYARLAARSGLDVWTLVPPRHLERAGGGRGGEAFVSPDLGALREAVEQLVVELRLLVALARGRGGEVALVGLSLGALGAALAATAPERIDRVALLAPPADPGAVLAGTPIGRRYARLAALAGAPLPDAAALAALLAPLRPDARPPTAGRILVAAGRDDRIALPAGALALARAGGAAVRLHPRGHLTLLFASRALRRDLRRFLAP